MRVKDKIALITGASNGIGYDTAQLLAQEGAQVIVTDIDVAKGQQLAQAINGAFFKLNVAAEQEWQELQQFIQDRYGRLDILFNNAGITGLQDSNASHNPEDRSLDDWRRVHSINLDGVFLGCKYGIGLMKKTGGSIINMSSRSGMVGIPEASAYASSKAAVRNHTKTVALYAAAKGYNIRCNSVHPGAIMTPMWQSMLSGDEAMQQLETGIPLGKMGEPLDVAYAVLYLAADESKYVTGAELIIDGGILAGSASSPSRD